MKEVINFYEVGFTFDVMSYLGRVGPATLHLLLLILIKMWTHLMHSGDVVTLYAQ